VQVDGNLNGFVRGALRVGFGFHEMMGIVESGRVMAVTRLAMVVMISGR